MCNALSRYVFNPRIDCKCAWKTRRRRNPSDHSEEGWEARDFVFTPWGDEGAGKA